MARLYLIVPWFFLICAPAASALADVRPAREFIVVLPADIASESVSILYMISGAFGGVSSYAEKQPERHSYAIPLEYENKPAREMTAVIYGSGCKFGVLEWTAEGHRPANATFECDPLPTTTISASVRLPDELRAKPNFVDVTYVAHWVNVLFGIMDGAVPEFEIAKVTQVGDRFEINVP